MRLEQNGEHVTLAFSRNGAGLGVAFDIAGWSYGELRPAVSLNEGQGVNIVRGDLPPLETMNRSTPPGEGIEGKWQGQFSLSIMRQDDKTFRLGARVANSIGCTVTETDGKFVSSGIRSTLMLPSEEDRELEQRVQSMLGNITGLRREGDTLVLESNEEKEIFNPAPPPNPAGRELITWMN